MCGIIGYIGSKPCVDIVFDGLKRLEYRGYDSAGIAVLHDGQIVTSKESGKLENLRPLLAQLPREARIGIGHTRWATHGLPTRDNAHPHVSERLALIHNGIIENYKELKAELQAKGVRFRSETDTEVVAHLIGEEIKTLSPSLSSAIRILSIFTLLNKVHRSSSALVKERISSAAMSRRSAPTLKKLCFCMMENVPRSVPAQLRFGIARVKL
jgi:glucosamine--fructose-6-phosphate aminotransferase (isomerizing)